MGDEGWAAQGIGGDDVEVALFIDWENLKLSLRDHFGVSPNIDSLLDAASVHGRVTLARAYADWTRPLSSVDAPNLYRAGIEPIYVPGREVDGRPLKNSADVRLAVDAVDIRGRLPHVRTFILVTGDGDLIHAVNHLQLGGRHVVVVGVRQSLSDLLAIACDTLLLYERDIEPLGGEALPIATANSAAPPLETAFEWVKAMLTASNDQRPYPFKRLRGELRVRHGLDPRAWYGLPFRHFMLQAERAGHVHLSTVGGLDYASLVRPEPRLDAGAEEDRPASIPEPAESSEVRLESLTDDEQRSLMAFIQRLQSRSPFMVRKYLVDNLEFESILPRFSRAQLDRLIPALVERKVLVERRETVVNPWTNERKTADTLAFNESSTFVQQRLSRADPFAHLLPALHAAQEAKGLGYFPLVQRELEARIGQRLTEFGYPRLTAFFDEAEQRGLVRVAHLANGADIVLLPEDAPPSPTELSQSASVLADLGADIMPTVLRIIAAAEDQIGGRPVFLGSLVYTLRHVLPTAGGPDLGSSQVNKLLKEELPRAGHLHPFPLSLNRADPFVREVLATGSVKLPAKLQIQPYTGGPATTATATATTPTIAERPADPVTVKPDPVTKAVPPVPTPGALPVSTVATHGPRRDPSWPTPEELTSDLLAGHRDVLFTCILCLLREKAPHPYRFTDLGNALRTTFGFQMRQHPLLGSTFAAVMEGFGANNAVRITRDGNQYFVELEPESVHEPELEPESETGTDPEFEPFVSAPVVLEQSEPAPTLDRDHPEPDATGFIAEPPNFTDLASDTVDPEPPQPAATSADGADTPPPLPDVADTILAAALHEQRAFEAARADGPISPVDWRKHLREAIKRAGGPNLRNPRLTAQLVKEQLIPRGIAEEIPRPRGGRAKMRHFRIRWDDPVVVALLNSAEDPAPRNAGG